MDPAAALANRVLERQSWAQQRLAEHAGRVFLVAAGPLSAAFRIESSGHLASQPLAGTAVDLSVTLSPLRVPSFLANPSRWNECVVATGDAPLAATLQDLAQTMPWFAEQMFADVLGPIVGQRVADAGRALLAFPGQAAERVGESLGSYARDEAGLVARGDQLQELATGVADLAARVDALERRMNGCAAHFDSSGSGAAGS